MLQPTTAKPRILPTCSTVVARQSSPFRMRVPTPRGVPRKEGGGVDAVSERWQYGQARLRHGSGILWSLGLPPSTVLRRLTAVEERDVRLPMAAIADRADHLVVDVSGAYASGKRYRFVGVVFETFHYDEASVEEAAFFDRMLDAMCYITPKPPPAATPPRIGLPAPRVRAAVMAPVGYRGSRRAASDPVARRAWMCSSRRRSSARFISSIFRYF